MLMLNWPSILPAFYEEIYSQPQIIIYLFTFYLLKKQRPEKASEANETETIDVRSTMTQVLKTTHIFVGLSIA